MPREGTLVSPVCIKFLEKIRFFSDPMRTWNPLMTLVLGGKGLVLEGRAMAQNRGQTNGLQE